MEIGRILRETREYKNLSLAEVEEATKIRKFYLSALENEDYQSLPGQVYTIGFIKAYARYLGLDHTPMVEQFKSRGESPVPVVNKTPRKKRKPNKKEENKGFIEKHGWKVLLLIIAALMVVFVMYQNGALTLSRQSINPAPEAGNPTAPNVPSPTPGEPAAEPNTPPPNTEAAEKELRIEMVAHGDCWTVVSADGKNVFNGTLKNGDKKTITAKNKVVLTLGSAGAVEVFRDGKSLGYLGAIGEVVRNKEFVLGSG
ncbi:MAG: helix-turn-helix domain-containing protein [Firmicutes bacterium]|nr:helix-turn-helix domain-containing protein [Bacillota bacterium]